MKRTTAVILQNGHPVAQTESNGRAGEVVTFGYYLVDNALNESREKDLLNVGTGTISRAKKYLEDDELLYELPDVYCEGSTATLACND